MSSTRRLRALLACTAALALAPGVAHAATIPSTDSGAWTDPTTWVGGQIPGSGDTAEIANGHAVTLTGNTTVKAVAIAGGGSLTLGGSKLTTNGDLSLLGGSSTPSGLSGGQVEVFGGELLVENTAVSNVAITVTGSGATTFSGPLPGDSEASSSWQGSTFNQDSGLVWFSGHKITGQLNPVIDASLTVRGVNDFGTGQLTLAGVNFVYFEPTALSGLNGAAMLSVGTLTVTGTQEATIDWYGIDGGGANGDRVNLISAPGGDVTDLTYTNAGHTTFGGPLTGEALYATFSGGNPRPAANPLPSVSSSSGVPGQAGEGDTITCASGTWTPDGTKVYSWSADGTPIGGATGSTYVVTADELDTDVRCTVAVTAAGLTGTAESSNAIHAGVVAPTPVATTPPSATSTRPQSDRAAPGDVITCNPGVWSPDGTKTYVWKLDGTPINGETATTYTARSGDRLSGVSCSVTVTAGGQSGTADSAAVQVGDKTDNTTAPSITGAVAPGVSKPGVQLTCNPGSWTLTPSYDYAWKRGATTVATTSTYTPVSGDAGATLTCIVTATFNDMPITATTPVGVAIVPVPENTAAPALSGDGIVGTQLTCAPGGWVGTPALAYAWTRGGAPLAGASSSTYTVTRADRNAELRCVVTATALDLERTATSAPVTAKAGAPITITARPEAIIAARSTQVAYTLAPDVAVTGCTFNGTALGSCASPIALDGLATQGDYALVLSLRNEYGEDETRTVSFATRNGGPTLLVHGWTGAAGSYRKVTATFEVAPGAIVACTLDGQPLACTPAGIAFLAPRNGQHVFRVTATDAHGASTTETLALAVEETKDIVPRSVTLVASTTIVLPSSVDLTGWSIDVLKGKVIPQVTPVSFGPDSFGLRLKAPATPGSYGLILRVPSTGEKEAIGVTVVAADEAPTGGAVGGVTSGKGPLTCTKGTPGTLYSWYVNDKLVRTDTSHEFPASMVPKNGIVECAAIDPEKGALPREQALTFDGTRAGVTISPGGIVSVGVSEPTEISLSLWGENANGATLASASKAKPKKAGYKTLKSFTKKLTKGSNKVKLGVKLPKRGYKITIKLKKGKRYSKPLVLAKR